jgi:hypothetical protein
MKKGCGVDENNKKPLKKKRCVISMPDITAVYNG